MLNAPLTPAPVPAEPEAGPTIPRFELTDTLHVFIAAQHLGLLEACRGYSRRSLLREQLEARIAHLRQQLYSVTLADLRRAGYDPVTCTEPTVRAEVSGPRGKLRLFLEWVPICGERKLGLVIPNDLQSTHIPTYSRRFTALDAAGREMGPLGGLSTPLLVCTLNVHRWLLAAIEDTEISSASAKDAANHWKVINEGVRRLTEKLAQMQRTRMPLVPDKVSELFRPLSIETAQGYDAMLATVEAQQRAAFQFLVNILRSAALTAELECPRPASRAARFAREIDSVAKSLVSFCRRGISEQVPGASRWQPATEPVGTDIESA